MKIIAAVLAIMALIGFVRVGICEKYSEVGFELWLKFAFVKIKIYPAKKKRKKSSKEETVSKVLKKESHKKRMGDLDGFKKIYRPAKEAIGDFLGYIRVKNIQIEFVSAFREDPAKTAEVYGEVCAMAGTAAAFLESSRNVKKYGIGVYFDFTGERPGIFFETEINIAIWQIIFIGIKFAESLLIRIIKEKGGVKHGKANC